MPTPSSDVEPSTSPFDVHKQLQRVACSNGSVNHLRINNPRRSYTSTSPPLHLQHLSLECTLVSHHFFFLSRPSCSFIHWLPDSYASSFAASSFLSIHAMFVHACNAHQLSQPAPLQPSHLAKQARFFCLFARTGCRETVIMHCTAASSLTNARRAPFSLKATKFV